MSAGSRAGGTRFAPGGVAWMLTHQARWAWRKLTGSQRGGLAVLAAFLLLGAGVAYSQLGGLVRERGVTLSGPLPAGMLVPLTLGVLFVFPLMVSQAINAALEALFTRGDLDLLLHSPVNPRAVLASRALGVAFAAWLAAALLCVPVILGAAALGVWRGVLGVTLWWLDAAVLAACLGLWITLGLVAGIGVRRTRTVAGVIAALTGAALFLFFQWQNLAGESGNAALAQILQGRPGVGGWPDAGSPLWFPVRAVWAEPLPTLAFTVGSVALLAVTVLALTRQFTAGVQEFAERGTPSRRAGHRARGSLSFRSGRTATLFKEWRLVWRDPELLSRTLLQLVYLLPLMAPVLRAGKGSVSAVTAVGVVLLSGNLASALANLTLNAEDAPDLLRTSPRPAGTLRGEKWLAAVLPVVALGGAAMTLLAFRGVLSGTAGAGLLALFLLGVSGSALMVLWNPLPVQRSDLFKSPPKPGLLSVLLQLVFQGGVAGAAFALSVQAIWGWWALLAALVALGVAWAGRRLTPDE